MREAIELLESITDEHGTDCLICYQHPHREQCPIGKALALLRAKPSAGEQAKELSRLSQLLLAKEKHIKTACDLLDAKDEEIEKHRWIPVSERLPETETEVWVLDGNATKNTDVGCYAVSPDYLGGTHPRTWQRSGHNPMIEITHWKPIILPEQALKDTSEKRT